MANQLQNLMAQTGFENFNHLIFNGSDLSIAEFDDRDSISEPELFTFNGNSNWTEFLFFGLHLLNDNLLCVFFNTCD